MTRDIKDQFTCVSSKCYNFSHLAGSKNFAKIHVNYSLNVPQHCFYITQSNILFTFDQNICNSDNSKQYLYYFSDAA